MEPFDQAGLVTLSSSISTCDADQKKAFCDALPGLTVKALHKGGHLDVDDVRHFMTDCDKEHPPRGVTPQPTSAVCVDRRPW